ncbi:VCBS repeat-containing protein [Maribacter arenosus]|uniref:VCBS repeat-containing protein n=1 Tax=Maribacter arenosus TaxID=1854708 RepID=A0ABR7VD89_9FLAO|nr:VCBS repeat-containing protein [Maribacter arenosus]MBD0850906.1 VCBS repeat-containing protein [Maribacter arenosus]
MQRAIVIIVSILFFSSCGNKVNESNFLFEELNSDHTNIDFQNIIPENELTNSFVYEYVYNGGGVAIGDVNNDGLNDIYFTSNLGDNALYLNQGNLQFENITKESGTKGKHGWTTGTNMVDINNDGLLDIYVCKSGPYEKRELLVNELYVNQGEDNNGIPTFKESAREFGLDDPSNSIQSAFLDFDRDGDLDMFLMNHNPQTFSNGTTETFSPLGDKFFINNNGKYENITKQVGIFSNSISYGLGVGVSDLNQDGWPDVYISNDYDEPDYMYINQQDGTFKEVIKKATNHIPNFSMGNDIADFDNDGFVDIMTLDMVSEDNYGMKTSMASMNPEKFNNNVMAGKHYQYMYNTFLKHSTYIDSVGIPFFSDVAQITGVSNTDWSWAPLLADFDNDGLKDLFITNGIKRDFRNKDFFASMQAFRRENADAMSNPKKINSLIERTPKRPHKNYFYKNNGLLNFSNESDNWLENPRKTYSNGAAYADLDNDGDLDLVINNIDEKASILKNNTNVNDQNFIQLAFNGNTKNTKGVGVKIIAFSKNGKQVFENFSVRGYQSSVPPEIHIGLGKQTILDSVLVFWPEGGFHKELNLSANKKHTISYVVNELEECHRTIKKKIFIQSTLLNTIIHKENDYNDYLEQVLLPHKMSHFGPALAVGDVNADGKEDLYFGQSSGETSVIYTQQDNGTFKEYFSFGNDAIFEDVDASFFDFDNDGDLDLYVASGGNEFESNSPNYTDRLYENRKGKFIKRPDLLPSGLNGSSSRVKIQDYNNDGFMDVFIGGRHMPHDYPAPANSHILQNKKGFFKDVTNEIAPELNEIGLVTDAIWTDFDVDGDMDLCLVGEWMKPTFFKNTNGFFEKLNPKILDSLSGWYFTVESFDFDSDGDDDYVLGNLGDNYKYKANSSEPFEVYYGDFDENGKRDLVLGYYNFGELYPVRGRECSSQQMPSIKKITPTYDEFGKSTLLDIYGNRNLERALHLKAFNFKSGILKNNRNADFEFIPLPQESQLSSINAILFKDLDQNGTQDLILAGNLFASEIETPRNDAGYGMVLSNNGDFKLEPINANDSGLFLPTDVKVLQIITINEEQYVVAGNNNNYVRLFRINRFK